MSDDRTKAELKEAAEEYGLSTSGTRAQLLERVLAFEDNGVVDEPEVEVVEVVEPTPAPEPAKPVESVLVKFTGKHPSYQSGNTKVSQKHPYAVVTPEKAEHLVHKIGLFVMVTPEEAKSYYS